MKELRRREIMERINKRKINAIERGVNVNLSKSVIEHFIANATKNNQSEPGIEQQSQTDSRSLRMNSQPSELNDPHINQSNP
jgi:hypothetical protein